MSTSRRPRTPPVPRWILRFVAFATLGAAGAPTAGAAQVASVRAGIGVGRVIPVSVFEEGTNLAGRPLRTVVLPSAEIGWRWRDPQLRNPEFGIGVAPLDVGDTDELGTSVSIYGWTRLPLAGDTDGAALTFDAAAGAAVGWRAFDPVSNPRQIAIGSPVTATFALGLSSRVPVAGRWSAVARAGYHHWSNGNLRQPNIGFNAMVGGVGVEWRPAPRVGNRLPRPPAGDASPVRGWTFAFHPFLGGRGLAADTRHVEQDDRYERQLFAVGGAHLWARRRLSRLWDVQVGVNGTIDTSGFRDHRAPELATGRIDPEPALSVGVAASGLLRTGPAELEFGFGWSPLDVGGHRGTSRWSQRLGIHLTAVPGLTPTIVLRALGFDRPDFIEWGVVIR